MDMSKDAPLQTVAIEVTKFYPRFAKAVKKSGTDSGLSTTDQEALISQLLLHVVQFQSNNNVIHLERHVKMAILIINDHGIEDSDAIISSWTPLLLVFTANFILLKLVERTPIWRMLAHVDGTLYITPE